VVSTRYLLSAKVNESSTLIYPKGGLLFIPHKPLTSLPESANWGQYDLDAAAYSIFLYLQQNPLIPVKTIADELGYSTTLVNARLESLKEQGFLRPSREIFVPFLGTRLQTEVEAVYDPNPLGLQRFNIFLEDIPDLSSLHELETFLAIHPYTHYHIALFNTQASLFVQFDIPPSAETYLTELLETLQGHDYYHSYSFMKQLFVAKSKFDFNRWQLSSNKWEIYSQNDLVETSLDSELDFLWRDFLAQYQPATPPQSQVEMVFDFDKIDMSLLRELTVNAKPNITKLSKHYEISRSRVSRRIKRLREQVVTDERLVYDQSIFDLSVAIIIQAKFEEGSDLTYQSFYDFLTADFLPFSTTAIMDTGQFLWYVVCPPSLVSVINRFVWLHAKPLNLYHLDIDSGRTYYFYSKSMVSKGTWKADKSYFIDSPLSNLEEIKRKKA